MTLAMDPISVQIREVRAAIKKSRETGKTVKLDNRDKERIYKTLKGEWRKTISGGSKSVKTKAPRGKYRDKAGRWRDGQAKGKLTSAPDKFAPIEKPTGLKSARGDAGGRSRVNDLLDANTPNSWELSELDPVVPRKSLRKGGGTIIGWRTRFEFDSSAPALTTFDEMATALLEIADDKKIFKIFGGRPSMVRVIFRSPEGYEQWLSLSSAIKFQIANKQAAGDLNIRSKRYTKFDKSGEVIRDQSYTILRVRFVIE